MKRIFFAKEDEEEELDPELRELKEQREKEENELFIKLFYPLRRKHKKEIWQLWENSINEEIYIRKKEINDYCEKNDCDFLTAICDIYLTVKYLFRCTYVLEDGTILSKYLTSFYTEFERLDSFMEERFIKYLNNGNPITEKQRETLNLMIEYISMERNNLEFDQSIELLRLVDPMRIFTFKYIHYEEIELKNMIEKLSKDRQNNPDEYINDNLRIKVMRKIIDTDILFNGHTIDMYYQVSKLETYINDSNQVKTIKESREPLKTNFSEKELNRIFNELVKNKYITCDLDLFLSCFGFKEDKEDKIFWMKTNTEFEIFISEIVQKEINSVNNTLGLPRKKINLWFVDKKSKEIHVAKKILNALKTYPIHKIIHPS